MLLLAIVLSFVPAFIYAAMIYWLDRYEREPKLLLVGIFAWGAIITVIQAIIFSLLFQGSIAAITQSESLAELAGPTVIAPVVEELTKGLAVLVVYLAARNEFDSILDGIVYASVVALGFAATENVLYLSSAAAEGGLEDMLVLFVLRVLLGGWAHAVYTAWIGIGLAIARLTKSPLLKIAAPLGGLVIAILLHGAFNTTVTLASDSLLGFAAYGIDWIGWFAVLGVALWATGREHRWLSTYLKEEVDLQVITPEQYRVACSAWARTGAKLRALFSGRRRVVSNFYQLCGELAQKKHQLAQFGNEEGNMAAVARLREDIRKAGLAVAA
ncbi:MAG: PrsW family intramembrane metalloprotease [Roseiflexaceae bacterium]